jgi:hypothetical protein
MTLLQNPAQKQEQESGPEYHTMSLADPGGMRRRGVMKLIGRGGVAMVAGLSSVFATARPAAAGLPSPCCHLASNTRCGGQCENYTCPSGRYKRYWWCTAGTRVIGCGECQRRSGSCWQGGTYYCSIWWDDGAC